MIFLDSSILVAAAQKQHSHHFQASDLLRQATPSGTSCGLHSLAEVYAVLSGAPRPHRLPPPAALLMVQQVRRRTRVISLTEAEYASTIEDVVALGLMGSILYDALLMRCAQKAKSTRIYSLNARHFKLVSPELASIVVFP